MRSITEILYEICEDEAVLDPDCELIESGILDSLAFIELFSALEDEGILLQPTRIGIRIKKTFPQAKVIFATSTAVLSDKMSRDFKRYNEEIEEYNKVAVEIVKKHGFEVNDLYSVSASLPEDAHSDAVHYYTAAGTKALTDQVLSYVVPALEIDEKITYQEDLHTDKPIGI